MLHVEEIDVKHLLPFLDRINFLVVMSYDLRLIILMQLLNGPLFSNIHIVPLSFSLSKLGRVLAHALVRMSFCSSYLIINLCCWTFIGLSVCAIVMVRFVMVKIKYGCFSFFLIKFIYFKFQAKAKSRRKAEAKSHHWKQMRSLWTVHDYIEYRNTSWEGVVRFSSIFFEI